MLRAALIDDERLHRKQYEAELARLLTGTDFQLKSYASIAQFEKGEDNLDALDLLLIDIQLGKDNGIDYAAGLKEKYPYLDIIFLSSYLHYAPDVYDVEHLSFIYKPEAGDHLEKAVAKALERKKQREEKCLRLRWKNTYFSIPTSEILYVEKTLRKTNVCTRDRIYSTYARMDDIQEELDDNFMRVHFSYLVNKNYIHEFHSDSLIMFDGRFIPVSRSYSRTVMEYIRSRYHAE